MDLYLPVKPTILIVDDSHDNLSLIANLLHEFYTVKAINHGEKALKIVSDEQPDLILLDINMLDVDGFEVCRRLKADPLTHQLAALQDVSILALASLAQTRDSDTGNHLKRTQHYMCALGNQLKRTQCHCECPKDRGRAHRVPGNSQGNYLFAP